jgi:hypothetical protein
VAAAERVLFSRAFHEPRLVSRDKYSSRRAYEREVAAFWWRAAVPTGEEIGL